MSAPAVVPAPASLRPPWDRRRVLLWAVAGAVIGLIPLSAPVVGLSPGRLVDGWSDLSSLLARMLPPTFADLGHTVELAAETFMIAVAGTSIAVALSLPVAFLAASNTSPHRGVVALARAVIVGARAVPDLVFALVFVRALGLGVLPGVLALALHSVGMLGKLFADAVEEVDRGPVDAVTSAGGGRLQSLATGVVPQVLPSFVGSALYRLDINLRTSVILGFVGAGGIGFELQDALRSLQYPRGLGMVLVIFVLIVGVEAVSSSLRRRLFSADVSTDRRRTRQAVVVLDGARRLSPPWTTERRVKALSLLATAVVVPLSFLWIEIDPVAIVTAVPDLIGLMGRFLPPDFTTNRAGLIDGMRETVAIGVVATFLGVAVATPVAFLAARNVAPARWVYYLARYFVVSLRGVPELVLALLFVSAVGLGPFAGALALSIGSAGLTAKLLGDAIEAVRQGPRDAAVSAGASRLQELSTAVAPQIAPSFVATVLYVLDVNIRNSVILGIVGGGGIGFILTSTIRRLDFERTGAILILIFVVVYGIERLAGWVRAQLI